MRLRATTRIRNDHILNALEELGWSQAEFCRQTGASTSALSALINLRYTDRTGDAVIQRIADALGLLVEQVRPEALKGWRVGAEFHAVTEIPIEELGDGEHPNLLVQDTQPVELEKSDDLSALMRELTERQRTVISMRYGLDGTEYTWRQIAKRFGVSTERARQIGAKGERTLRALAEKALSAEELRALEIEDRIARRRIRHDPT